MGEDHIDNPLDQDVMFPSYCQMSCRGLHLVQWQILIHLLDNLHLSCIRHYYSSNRSITVIDVVTLYLCSHRLIRPWTSSTNDSYSR